MNKKQMAWSKNKVFKSRMQIAQNFAICIIGVLFIFLCGMVISGNLSIDYLGGLSTITAGVVLPFTNVSGNPENAKRTGKIVKNKIYFIHESQVDDNYPFPTRMNRAYGNIPLKAGEYWKEIECINDSVVPKSSGKNGEVSATISNELSLIVGGLETDVLDFLERGISQRFYLVFDICGNDNRMLGGNGCKPLILDSFEWASDKDKTAANVIFTNTCGEMWSEYVGNTPIQAPVTVAADAVTIGLTSSQQYQLTTGATVAAAITGFTGVTDADITRIVTVLGSGGAHPSTISSTASSFLLIGGQTWTAALGKQISFRIYKDGDASYKFIEIAGSRN